VKGFLRSILTIITLGICAKGNKVKNITPAQIANEWHENNGTRKRKKKTAAGILYELLR